MTKFNRFAGVIALALMLVFSGCAKRVPLTPLQSTQLTLSQSLNVAAHAGHALRLTAETLQTQGILPTDKTREVLAWVREADVAIQKAVPLSTGTGDPKQVAQSVLDVIGAIPQLPATVTGLASGTQRQEVLDLVSLAQTFWSDIKAITAAATSQKGSQ